MTEKTDTLINFTLVSRLQSFKKTNSLLESRNKKKRPDNNKADAFTLRINITH